MKKIEFTRRRFIGISSLLLSASLLHIPTLVFGGSNTHDDLTQFMDLSKTLTGYQDLDAQLSARYLTAFSNLFPDFISRLKTLYQTPSIFAAMASSETNKALALQIVHAWYTGTVGPNDRNEGQVVAYKDALMYRPTQDGLPVPTYCFRGELWFSALPPGITQEPLTAATF